MPAAGRMLAAGMSDQGSNQEREDDTMSTLADRQRATLCKQTLDDARKAGKANKRSGTVTLTLRESSINLIWHLLDRICQMPDTSALDGAALTAALELLSIPDNEAYVTGPDYRELEARQREYWDNEAYRRSF
jgi:hypothetical protein